MTNSNKHKIIQLSFIAASIILIAQSAKLQLFDKSIRTREANITLHKKTILPSRGMIFDRNGGLLVANDPLYDLEVVYSELNPEMDTSKFCQLLQITKDEFKKKLDKNWRGPYYSKSLPFIFLQQIDAKVFSVFQEHIFEFAGFYPILRNVRKYPHTSAAHALGYLGEVNQQEIDNSDKIYKLGDFHGVSGLERHYETQLRGAKGIAYILKDNLGREVESLAEGGMDSSAVSGTDLIISLDLELQKFGEEIMHNKKGSIVAIEPSTGEILCSISAPAYDPNILSINNKRSAAFSELLKDTLNQQPFLDRAIMAVYPPGSIFKPIFSLIALQENITYADRSMKCDGEYEINKKGQSQKCRKHPRPINLQSAIRYSCNSYFYQLMREFLEMDGYTNPSVGLDKMGEYLSEFAICNVEN